MCAGANVIRNSLNILSGNMATILNIRFNPVWVWSAYNSVDCFAFMEGAGGTCIYDDATDLHTGTGRLWCAGNTQRRPSDRSRPPSPVEAIDLLFADMRCGPLSTKNKVVAKNLSAGAGDTDTKKTMNALIRFASNPQYNSSLRLIQVENIKQFATDYAMGESDASVATRCLKELNLELSRCRKPYAGAHKMHLAAECEEPQSRKRMHMSYWKDPIRFEQTMFDNVVRDLRLETRRLEEYMDDPDVVQCGFLGSDKVGRNVPCTSADRELMKYCLDRKPMSWPPDLDQSVQNILGLPESTIVVRPNSFTERELKLLYSVMNVGKMTKRLPVDCWNMAAFNDSLELFRFRPKICPTITSTSRLLGLYKASIGTWVLRQLSTDEQWRLQSAPLTEVFPMHD